MSRLRAGLREATAVLPAVLSSACVITKPYMYGVSPIERVEECRLLDRKVTETGQLNAIGTFLAGGAGLAAGFKNNGSETYGILSGVFGLFAAWSAWTASRQNGRFEARQCGMVLNPDPKDTTFLRQLQEIRNDPHAIEALDSGRDAIAARRDSLKAARRRK